MEYCQWDRHRTDTDVTLFEVAGGRYPVHSHRGFHEFLIVMQGRLRHRVNGESARLAEGEVILIREKDQHELLGGRGVVVNLPFTTDWFERLEDFLACPGWAEPWLAGRPPQTRLEPPVWPVLRAQLEELLTRADPAEARAEIAGLILTLLTRHLRSAISVPEPGLRLPVWLRQLQDELAGAIPVGLTVGDLARRAGCTPEHLARTFRRYLDQTPAEYLNAQKLSRAARLLSHTDRRIKEIAALAGFATPGHFCRQFRRQYGQRPGDYRQVHSALPTFPHPLPRPQADR